MKKIIFTIITLTICFMSANSQTMTVKLKNGQKVTYQTSGIEGVEFEEAYNPGDGAKYHNGHEYVDLGLPSGKLWATCNVGANKPEEIGSYFAWGETDTKDYFSEDNSEYYQKEIGSNISGTEYDVAHVKWGGNWRMPTKMEISEMTAYCTWSIKYNDGKKYFLGKGPSGKEIILPATGTKEAYNVISDYSGSYWTSESNDNWFAHYLTFDSPSGIFVEQRTLRWRGKCIRAIFTPEN